ncbi:MAG TPA: carbohydrate-binding protein [Humisphaera sp.]
MNTPTTVPADRPATAGPARRLPRRLTDAARRRFRRARPGSVLILVVALLVLMALIGTALITTTGTDRSSSAQGGHNTQVDLLVQAAKDMVAAAVVKDIASSNGTVTSFRPAVAALPATPADYPSAPYARATPWKRYAHVTYSGWSPWLASRFPVKEPTSGVPVWTYLTGSPIATPGPDVNVAPLQFASPLNGLGTVPNLASRLLLFPDSVTINGVVHPALVTSNQSNDPQGAGKKILAADTDGDGIADAGLFELPFGPREGVKYYVAVRIVDNGASINATTAWDWINTGTDANLPVNVFPSNIGLKALLDSTDPNKFGTANAASNGTYNFWRNGNQSAVSLTPRFDTTGTAAGFQSGNRFDALWTGLGSRPENPTFNGNNNANNKFQALGVGGSVALAQHGGLVIHGASSSKLDEFFPRGVAGIGLTAIRRDQPYAANQFTAWYNGIYNYEGLGAANTPIRPLLVGSNGAGTWVPSFFGPPDAGAGGGVPDRATSEMQRAGQYAFVGAWAPAKQYGAGEWVRYNGRAYVCISDHTSDPAIAPPQPGSNEPGHVFWAVAPWFHAPVKMNVNTVGFGALTAAFNAVMGDGPEIALQGGSPDPGYGASAGGPRPYNTPWTFGNVLRPGFGGNDGDVMHVKTRMVKRLRAAQAAVNAIDLRDADDDVTSRTVRLSDDTQAPLGDAGVRWARVYGTEKQPYITMAMVHFDDVDYPYVLLELYNPHTTAINLGAYTLAYRSRTGGGKPLTLIRTLGGTIPPNGYYYVESDTGRRPTEDMVTTFPGTIVEEPLLKAVVEGGPGGAGGTNEMFLLRTRRADGQPTSSNHPANTFNEGTPGGLRLEDLVPADNVDFDHIGTGIDAMVIDPDTNAPVMPVPRRYHYRRATATPWNCVYAGPYNRTAGEGQRRLRGWIRDPRPLKKPTPNGTFSMPGVGAKTNAGADPVQNLPDGGSSTLNPQQSTFRTRTFQAANADFGGPYKSPNTRFPYGSFARDGDMLQIPFAGAYRIDINHDGDAFPEMNSLSLDLAFVEDGDMADDGIGGGMQIEQLGRFAPFYKGMFGNVDDLQGRANAQNPLPTHRFAWATDLFDYLTVMSPENDYLPNVDPTGWDGGRNGGDPTVNAAPALNTPKFATTRPQAVPNGPTVLTPGEAKNDGREDGTAVQGQINLNTAPWKVIATIPFTTSAATNRNIAYAIYSYRESVAPLRNLFDLYKVDNTDPAIAVPAGFTRVRFADLFSPAGNPTRADGDMSPLTGDDGVAGDFEARYLMMTKISNMVTFRSDSFTAYVLVQGWRNAGTSAPELVVQRRAAMIIDRSTVHPLPTGGFSDPVVTNVPQN